MVFLRCLFRDYQDLSKQQAIEISDGFVMPWPKVQAEIVQPTADFEHQVTESWLPISGLVFDNPIALDTANGMLDAHPNTRDEAITHFVCVAKLTASGFLFRL